MAIFNVLSQTGFIMVNRMLAKAVGLDAAILLGELCTRQEQHGGEFWATNEQLEDSTTLSPHRIRNASATLVENEFITVEAKGLPRKNFYTVSEDSIIEFFTSQKPSDAPRSPEKPETPKVTQTKAEKPVTKATATQDALFDVPKEEKMKLGDFQNVPFTEDELAKLKAEFPDDWEARIEAVSNWAEEKGKRVKSGLATIRNWAKRDNARQSRPDAPRRAVNTHPGTSAPAGSERAEKAVERMVDALRFNWPYMVEGRAWAEPEITGTDIANAEALLSKGRTVEDFRHVAVGQLAAWGNQPSMIKNIRPRTLLNPERFGDYLAESANNVLAFRNEANDMDRRCFNKKQQSPRERYVSADNSGFPAALIASMERESQSEEHDMTETREFEAKGGVEMKFSKWVRSAAGLKEGFTEIGD